MILGQEFSESMFFAEEIMVAAKSWVWVVLKYGAPGSDIHPPKMGQMSDIPTVTKNIHLAETPTQRN